MYFDKKPWQKKIKDANKYYEEWESTFLIKKLEKYYEGNQWEGFYTQNPGYRPYTLNLIFQAIQRKLVSMVLKHPEFEISPTPGNSDWDQSSAVASALLKQDVINAIISNPNLNFAKNTRLVGLDSFFRFGMLEVNHAADFNNPLKTPIITTEFTKENVTPEQSSIVEDLDLPISEQIYFKHIKASRFRVSTSDSMFLNNCSWCGYYTYVYESTLQKSKGIKFPSLYVPSDYVDATGRGNDRNAQHSLQSGKVCKVWKIWDNETKYYHLFLDGYFDTSLEKDEIRFDNLPFEDLIWADRVPGSIDGGYYPIPPVFNWLSPQDEVNQAREQMRNFRRRYTRKFGYLKGKIEPEELDKFKTEYDGEMIEFKSENAVFPIENPAIGATITSELQVSSDDFNKAAAISQVQQSDRTTATQSKINATRETMLEDAEQLEFMDFLCRTGRKGLIIAKEKLVTGIWVKYTTDPGEDLFGQVQMQEPIYRYVSAQDIDDGYDFTIKMNVIDANPDRMQDEQNKFILFLKLLSTFPMISMSPTTITECARVCGYRNLKVIGDLQRMAIISLVGQAQVGQQSLEGQQEASMQANSSPSPSSETGNQLESQLA